MQEKMSQEEIDKLMQSIGMGELEDPVSAVYHSTLNPEECKFKYSAISAGTERYDYALLNGSFEDVREARKNLHRAGFNNWLLKHSLTKNEYYEIINRELIKRGYPPFFRIV